jgi:hypothetical protein
MCPVCIATASLIAAGAISTGGLTAFAVRKFLTKRVANEISPNLSKENHNG